MADPEMVNTLYLKLKKPPDITCTMGHIELPPIKRMM